MVLPHDEQGEGPAVVLLHAGILDRSMWAGALSALAAAGFRAVALDLPGFGEAAPAAGPQAPWDDVLETITALGIDGAALVGASYGGAVALRSAALHRGRFWGLVLVAAPAPGVEPSPELANRWAEEERALDAGDLPGAAAAVAKAWVAPDAPPRVRELVESSQLRAFALQAAAPAASDAPDPLHDDPDRLPAIDVPTLVLTGDEDLVDFREGGKLLARLLPGAHLTTLRGAGHLPALEQPCAFEQLLLDFLTAQQPA